MKNQVWFSIQTWIRHIGCSQFLGKTLVELQKPLHIKNALKVKIKRRKDHVHFHIISSTRRRSNSFMQKCLDRCAHVTVVVLNHIYFQMTALLRSLILRSNKPTVNIIIYLGLFYYISSMGENVWAWSLDREKCELGYMYCAVASVNSMLSKQVIFLSQKMQGIL